MEKTEKAAFAAGCFWGVEDVFSRLEGVLSTRVGYMGGDVEYPSYQEVCTGTTGHAETVEITFDPETISYRELLNVFWRIHDPTTPNRQGPDVGEQYRSVIFYTTPEQKVEAQKSLEDMNKSGKYPNPIVTQIMPYTTFYEAEEYHQKYLQRRGGGSCHF